MTRKHFKRLAKAMADSKPFVQSEPSIILTQWRLCCERVADACQEFNDNFDRMKFLKACGYYE